MKRQNLPIYTPFASLTLISATLKTDCAISTWQGKRPRWKSKRHFSNVLKTTVVCWKAKAGLHEVEWQTKNINPTCGFLARFLPFSLGRGFFSRAVRESFPSALAAEDRPGNISA